MVKSILLLTTNTSLIAIHLENCTEHVAGIKIKLNNFFTCFIRKNNQQFRLH